MCDSTPIGELCETRVAMMKSDTETFTNGHGENQEVLVVVVVVIVVVVVVVVVVVLQIIIQPLSNDHPEDTAFCK